MVPLLRVFHVRDARLPVIGALVALAWLTLAIWGQSPYGRYLDHGQWLQSGFVGGFVGTICRAVPAGTALFAGLVYVAAWLLMTVAMMLPTTMPLLAIFARMTADRDDRGLLLTLVVAGYLSIWTAFGLIAHLADMSLHAAVATNVFLSVNSWIVGVIVLALAGAFQFSKLKYRCLDKCRTPFSFCSACTMACFASAAAGQLCS
jgi:predicted metal-binding membrane protein